MARIIISILLCFIGFQSHSQIAMFHAHNQFEPYAYLIDESPSGAYAAYSLRKLNSSYSGNCIKVRRSSDNTEQDIGFSNNYLDTNALKSFVSSGTGYVTVWYDQTSTWNWTQTTQANQPHIVDAGVVYRINGNVSINFGTWTDEWWMTTATGFIYNATSLSYVQVSRADHDEAGGVDYYGVLIGNTGGNTGFEVLSFTKTTSPISTIRLNGTYISGAPISPLAYFQLDNAQCLSTFFGTSARTDMYRNSVVVAAQTHPAMPTLSFNGSYLLGKYGLSTSNFGNFDMQEVIFYNTDKLSDRSIIESNINSFYSIY